MQEIPLLKDFYDKSVVPVGETDRVTLLTLNHHERSMYETVTHWLIALIWYEDRSERGWKVSVYPICKNKPFWILDPYYETRSLHSFDIALKMSRILETHSQQDNLTARQFYQEINELTGLQAKASQ